MKNFFVAKNKRELHQFIRDRLIRPEVFYCDPFYSRLINYIVEERAPIFYEPSSEEEHAHFTAYFNLVLLRDTYTNPFIEALYYLHDFVHMLFWNPLRPKGLGKKIYSKVVINNECAASNETEILAYYRIHQLRENTFEHPILFDLLKKTYPIKPSSVFLLNLRQSILNNAEVPQAIECDPRFDQIRTFFGRFAANNPVWCDLWYREFPKMAPRKVTAQYFSNLNYEKQLLSVRYKKLGSDYSVALARTINTAHVLAGSKVKASNIEECLSSVQSLSEKIILPNAAKLFHLQYKSSLTNSLTPIANVQQLAA